MGGPEEVLLRASGVVVWDVKCGERRPALQRRRVTCKLAKNVTACCYGQLSAGRCVCRRALRRAHRRGVGCWRRQLRALHPGCHGGADGAGIVRPGGRGHWGGGRRRRHGGDAGGGAGGRLAGHGTGEGVGSQRLCGYGYCARGGGVVAECWRWVGWVEVRGHCQCREADDCMLVLFTPDAQSRVRAGVNPVAPLRPCRWAAGACVWTCASCRLHCRSDAENCSRTVAKPVHLLLLPCGCAAGACVWACACRRLLVTPDA